MNDINIEHLKLIGFTQAIRNHFFNWNTDISEISEISGIAENTTLVRIVEVQRDCFIAHTRFGECTVRVLPKLLADLQEQGENLAIGDWVLIRADAFGELWVNGLLPPLNQLARRANDGRRQVLAANIDTALLVMGLDHDFNLRRMERYIALVHASGIAALAVMSKADIGIDVDARLAQLRQRLPASVPVLAVNALDRQASVELAPWTGAGQTLVVLGSSGVGKSTLTNTLTASSSQQTGGNRKGDGRGRHTTTARSLHLCEGGACIIDTPGLRTWRPDADEQALAATFTDIEALAEHCQFRDCCHQGEPGCAVAAAVPADRLLNYHKLLREARRSQQTHLERSAQLSKWKKISKAARQRSREKRA